LIELFLLLPRVESELVIDALALVGGCMEAHAVGVALDGEAVLAQI
jgi:hypothetical protein